MFLMLLVSTKVSIAVSTNKQQKNFSDDSYLILLLLQVTFLVKLRGQLKVTFQMVNSSDNHQI